RDRQALVGWNRIWERELFTALWSGPRSCRSWPFPHHACRNTQYHFLPGASRRASGGAAVCMVLCSGHQKDFERIPAVSRLAVKGRTRRIRRQPRRVDAASPVRSNVGRVPGGALLGASGDGGLKLSVI